MILEEVRLRNWRGVRGEDGERAARFQPGLNLLVGPNESGKSSLLEAVLRGLLDRHGSRTVDLRRVRPWGSSLAPEVRLVLHAGGQRLRVEKRFLSDPFARVYVERQGRFELTHEGDRADLHLRKLLLEESKRGSAKASHRGIAQALWYLQRDDPLPRQWSDALEEGLASLVGSVLTDPLQDRVLQRLRGELASLFTPTGRIKARSELKGSQDERDALRRELEERRRDIGRAERYREELEGFQRQRGEAEERLRAVREERRQLDLRSAGAPELEEEIARLSRGLEELRGERERGRRRLAELEQAGERLQAAAVELERHEDREAQLRVAVREHRRAAERHARRWEDELQPKLVLVRSEIEDLRTKMRIEQLEAELEAIDRRMARIEQLEAQLAEARQALTVLGPAELDDVQEARRLHERATVLRAQTEAAAIVVEWSLDRDVEVAVDPDDEPTSRSARRLVTRPTALRIDGVGTFHVRSNDQKLETMDQESRRTRERLTVLLERCRAESVEELLERSRQAGELRRRVGELAARLAESLEQGDEPADDGDGARSPSAALATRRRELAAELAALRAAAPQAVLPGMEDWAEERTLDQLRVLEERRQRLEKQIREEREAEQAAQQACLERNEELVAAGQLAAGLRAESGAHRAELERHQSAFGSVSTQRQRQAQLQQEEQRLDESLEERRQTWREQVERPRERQQELARQEAEWVERLRQLDAERADRRARIEEVTGLGLDSRIGDLEGKLAAVEDRCATLERRAEATRLLGELVAFHEADQNASLVEPVRELLDRWLGQLTEERYRGVSLGDDLVPSGVQPSGYDESQPLESVSHGSYEQIAVLLRLALGVLLSSDERQLVVLDDGLVNADATRQQRLLPILEEAAQHCQVIVATCQPSAYAGLDAHTIELEATPRWSPRVLARDAEPGSSSR
ncbi:MAG: hypothetical protein DWQ36_09800 [Acidobacteria bacterium]|nr:MAG: hypothetical protein DWQ30_01080 [Acidobacteriota bacterium]REK08354.1 MAG: hypothetical protein DWQ36_09800 [Acidobacteriota bacterium]